VKLYHLRWGYDYHGAAGFSVIASSKEAAVKRIKEYVKEEYGVDNWRIEEYPIDYSLLAKVHGQVIEHFGGC